MLVGLVGRAQQLKAMSRNRRPPATWSDSSGWRCSTRWRTGRRWRSPRQRPGWRAAPRLLGRRLVRVSERKTGTLPTGSMTTDGDEGGANSVASSVISMSGMGACGWGEGIGCRVRRAGRGRGGGDRPGTSTPAPAFPAHSGGRRLATVGTVDFRRTTVAALAADVAARRVSARELAAAPRPRRPATRAERLRRRRRGPALAGLGAGRAHRRRPGVSRSPGSRR